MKLKASFLLMTFVLLPSLVYGGPQYIQSTPLAEAIKVPVGDIKEEKTVRVPLITWGGDIATIWANGNAPITSPGSIFDQQGLNLQLVREDDFVEQLKAYISGESPYLRGTMGMINAAVNLLGDPRTRPVVIYQMTWSTGGDALVVKEGIKTTKDLKGKTIAVQAYGPHVDYLTKVLSDAGLSASDVTIRWLKDLTGTDNTPVAALRENDVDAAFVIIPDALALTSGGNVGTGSEDSVRGARILLSTKTANRIIADVYAVRSDYLENHRTEVEKFVHGLMIAEEMLRELVRNKSSRTTEYQQMISASAEILLDSAQAVADTEGLYADCQYVGWKGNVKFFGDPDYPRNLDKLAEEIQTAYLAIGLLNSKVQLDHARWDYDALKQGLTDVAGVETPRFDTREVASVVARRQQQGVLGEEGVLFSFEIYFQPNQNDFPIELYQGNFEQVINLASTYGGAIITVEGHSDPLGFLKRQSDCSKGNRDCSLVLNQIKQAAKNLSLSRANAVKDSIIGYANSRNVTIDSSQFATVGHGIMQPKGGRCGEDPCPPKNEQEWRNNMRVEFRIIQVEAETSVFKPLD